MPDIQVSNLLTLGNLLTILIFIGSMIVNIIIITSKISKFVAITEMKFQVGSEKFVEHDTRLKIIDTCIKTFVPREDINKIEGTVEFIRGEQIKLRAELPDKEWYRNIELKLNQVQSDVQMIKEQVFKDR